MKSNFTRIYRYILCPLIILAIVLLVLFQAGVFSPQEELSIAIVGPMSGPEQDSGDEMVKGAKLYLDQINRQGGVNGKLVRLLVFDDQDNPDLARQRAQEIVDREKALIVLGHLYSSTSMKGGEVYKQYGIPAITGSATADSLTEGNEWYFRTIFTDRSQASYLANYVKRILRQGTVSIVYDQDDYGTSLARMFESRFTDLGGTIKHKWSFDSQGKDLDQALAEIGQNLVKARVDDPGTIFVAAHETESEKIVVSIRRNNLPYPILGADVMGDESFAARFNKYPEEKAQPGYFTDGIYATSPIIFDVAGQIAQQLRHDYADRYGGTPGWTTAAYFDATMMAVEAMKVAGVRGDPAKLAEERQKVRDSLGSINRIEMAKEGACGYVYFDQHRSLVDSVDMGFFDNGQYISAAIQLQPVTDIRRVADLQSEMDAEHIFLVDGQYMYKTQVVYTGIELNQVSDLDTKASSYNVDFYLWFRYHGQLDDANLEFGDADEPVKLGKPLEERTSGDVTYRLYHIKADFRSNFVFHDYPFDRQQLEVRFRHANLTRDHLIYVLDTVGLRDTSSQAFLKRYETAQTFGSLGYWNVIQINLFQDTLETKSTLGNPQYLDSDPDIDASRFNLVIYIQRNALDFMVKNLFPVFIVVGMSYLVFFLAPKELGTRIGIGTSTLLTIAFFDLNLSSHLPDIGYVVAIEYFFYVVYSLAAFGICVTISGYIEAGIEKRDEKEALIRRLNLVGKILYPTVIAITFAIYAYHYHLIALFGQ